MEEIRLDKYLWAVRVFKTRSDAADAIRTNKVTVNGSYAKPSREVKIGDVIAVRKMQVTYSYKVLDLVSSRQPAKNVPAYCLNITPQEELDKLNGPRDGTSDQEGATRTRHPDGRGLLRRRRGVSVGRAEKTVRKFGRSAETSYLCRDERKFCNPHRRANACRIR